VRLDNNALQPIAGAGTAGVNRRRSALAPPSAERERYAGLKNSNND
jgi:hypothetical protein